MSGFFDVEAWQQVVLSSLSELGGAVAGLLPSLLGVAVILGFGWLLSRG